MPIHQADIHGFKKAQDKVDEKVIDRFFDGDCDLAEALGVSDELIDGMRRQALALYESGKYQNAVQVVLGLVAMGRVHPADPLLLARCYEKLGKLEAAAECNAHGERLLSAMGIEIPPAYLGAR
ncbi:CDC27 family protein [Myxococcota bacterium]|nr:CDC27 family protein [Myxococcota bacterium]